MRSNVDGDLLQFALDSYSTPGVGDVSLYRLQFEDESTPETIRNFNSLVNSASSQPDVPKPKFEIVKVKRELPKWKKQELKELFEELYRGLVTCLELFSNTNPNRCCSPAIVP